MSETEPGHPLSPGDAGEPQEPEQTRVPRRVIGTPPPAQARIVLADPEADAEPPAPRELPDGPDNPAVAKTAERIIAACFILSMLASIGFIAAYVGRLLLRLVYGVRFTDLSPFRAIRRDVLDRLGMVDMTYGWNLEMLMRVAAADLPAHEIAVGQRRRVGGVSKVSGNFIAGIKAACTIAVTFVRLAFQLRRNT